MLTGDGLAWLANNLERVRAMCCRVNNSYQDELLELCIDCIDEVHQNFEPARNIPLDRYIMNILRRRCITHCAKLRSRVNGDHNVNEMFTLPSVTIENREYLLKIIEGLSATERELTIYHLYVIDNYTFGEIADQLNSSESTVRRTYWGLFWRIRKTCNDNIKPK